MPKKILYESAIHQLLRAAHAQRESIARAEPRRAEALDQWIAALRFQYPGPGTLRVDWSKPVAGSYILDLQPAKFYMRGDAAAHATRQAASGLTFSADHVMDANRKYFGTELQSMLAAAGLTELAGSPPADAVRKHSEQVFHDEWAAFEDVDQIDVRQRNEACTAPEMRYLRSALGDLRGRRLLDVGCGLGEASVYFALHGAVVTATDISPKMCEAAQRLARANGVTLTTHVSAIEDLGLPPERKFDVIFTANTLHHAAITAMLDAVLPHLESGGVFASWDPVAYNPLINVYRHFATAVRTVDEHPLRRCDVREVTRRFARSEVRWFWLTTLVIFVIMALVQFRNPNKERFWKKVIDEADRWAWLYHPLEKLDTVLQRCFPFLCLLCWNVAIVAHGPLPRDSQRSRGAW